MYTIRSIHNLKNLQRRRLEQYNAMRPRDGGANCNGRYTLGVDGMARRDGGGKFRGVVNGGGRRVGSEAGDWPLRAREPAPCVCYTRNIFAPVLHHVALKKY